MSIEIKTLTPPELTQYDRFVSNNPAGNFLQTSAWAKVKNTTGWRSEIKVVRQDGEIVAGAQVFTYGLPFGQKLSYIPGGPLGDDKTLLPLLRALKEDSQGVAIKVEPYQKDSETWQKLMREAGFKPVSHSLQPEDTLILDLTRSEEDLLGAMHQTTRRYIRQAERAGLTVEEDKVGKEISEFHRIQREIGRRAQFGVHSESYYQSIWDNFPGQAHLFLVKQGPKVIGAYFLLQQGKKSWELYGGVREEGLNLRANYLLKWTAIKAMKAEGVAHYDQWGVAPLGVKNHPLSGVTYFKEGFGGERVHMIGSFESVSQTHLYRLIQFASTVRATIRARS